MHESFKTMVSQFEYLDQKSIQDLYTSSEDPLRMQMYIEGIKCIKCVNKIESVKTQLPGLAQFELNMATQVLDFKLTDSKYKYAEVADRIEKLGFKVIPLAVHQDANSYQEIENQNDLIRIGVAGFLAGNIMILSFAVYFGLAGSLKVFFEWLQFLLYLPFVSYVAWPFYKGFASGIKSRQISIDGPMAIASLLGFAASSYHLLIGQGSIYFDSLSGFLFLILVTRYFQRQARTEYLKYLKPSALVETLKARLPGGQWVRTDTLKAGDIIEIQKNEWIPVDGSLRSQEIHIDTTLLNGESHYKRILEGQKVEAGSRLLSKQASILVSQVGMQTTFGRLLSHAAGQNEFKNTETSKGSDKAAQLLLVTVLSVALVLLTMGFFWPDVNYFERGLALIILACPCAMAFGTPLAMALVMKRAQSEGLLVKSFHSLESAKKIKTIFLDKTGTVTSLHWQVNSWASLIDDNKAKKIILALESVSDHPIADALRSLWSDISIDDYSQFSDLQEIPSKGVQGLYGGYQWVFESVQWLGKKYFVLKCNGIEQCRFQLSSFLDPQAIKVIQNFQKQNYKVCLVSGDKKQEVLDVGAQLGITPSNCFYELTAEQKMKLVKSEPNSMMVGDGANDSLAFTAAELGVAVSGSVDLALRSADILFLKNDLKLLNQIFYLSELAQKQVKKNLRVALIYNFIGATLAIFGLASPFVAALLMPMSSLFILAYTWWGTQK